VVRVNSMYLQTDELACEREDTHIVSAVTPIKHAFRLAVRIATDRYPTSVPATALKLSDCGVVAQLCHPVDTDPLRMGLSCET
jgi:hypothetical protein